MSLDMHVVSIFFPKTWYLVRQSYPDHHIKVCIQIRLDLSILLIYFPKLNAGERHKIIYRKSAV